MHLRPPCPPGDYAVTVSTGSEVYTGISLTIPGSTTTTTISDGNGGETTMEDYGMTFVSIPGGTFEMGCSPGDDDCYDDEYPRHTVTISSFKMSAYEITQGQWMSVMGETPSYFSDCGDDCPVEVVSWNDVQDFIDELNRQTGKNYHLPTEAEWEYAARTEWRPNSIDNMLS